MILVPLFPKIIMSQTLEIAICVIISEKQQIVSGDIFLSMLSFIPENMLK